MKYIPYQPFYSSTLFSTVVNKCKLIYTSEISQQHRKILRDDIADLANYLIASNRRRMKWQRNHYNKFRREAHKILKEKQNA